MNKKLLLSDLYLDKDEQLKVIFNITQNKNYKEGLLKIREFLNNINEKCQILYNNFDLIDAEFSNKIVNYKTSFIDPSLKLCDRFLDEIDNKIDDNLKKIINIYKINDDDADEVKLIKQVCLKVYTLFAKNNINEENLNTVKRNQPILNFLQNNLGMKCYVNIKCSWDSKSIINILDDINDILLNKKIKCSSRNTSHYNIDEIINNNIQYIGGKTKEDLENSEIITLLKIYNLIKFKIDNKNQINDKFIELFKELYKTLNEVDVDKNTTNNGSVNNGYNKQCGCSSNSCYSYRTKGDHYS